MTERRSQPWVMYALIVANVAMFGVELANGASPIVPSPQDVVELGGNFPPNTLHGEWWRLGSSLFLHFGSLHLALNMLCLYQARAVESLFGRVGYLVIYGLAGLGGGIASLLTNPGNLVVAGASACVFGVFGAYGVKLVLHRAQFDPEVWTRTTRRLAKFLVLNAVVGFTVPGISLSSHVGGLVVGTAVGAALLAGASTARSRAARALGLAELGIALTGIGVMTIHADAGVPSVFVKFHALEQTRFTTMTSAAEELETGKLTRDQYFARLEQEVFEPYRKLQEEMRATREVPERLRTLLALDGELVVAHLAAWEASKAAAAAQDPEKLKTLLDAEKRAYDKVAKRSEGVTVETNRLKP